MCFSLAMYRSSMNIMQRIGWIFILLNVSCQAEKVMIKDSSIDGVCLVAPRNPIQLSDLDNIQAIDADWVAVVPYAFNDGNSPLIRYSSEGYWWGEGLTGVIETIRLAKEAGLKIMLKPHVWVKGQGWPGDFTLNNEADWQQWEQSYAAFTKTMTQVADSMDVEIFCIGTEHRQAVIQRPEFWKTLIDTIRTQYHGKLTYAANWDNYENVLFWGQLDYIGIDAYFPLSEDQTPSVETLVEAWEDPVDAMLNVQQKYEKPILFTEYGYRSTDFTAHGHWHYGQEDMEPNMEGQQHAYEALYQVFWDKPWFAGGFIWKWYTKHDRIKEEATDYTPQDKPAAKVIRQVYER